MNNLVSLNRSIVRKHKKEFEFLHFFGGRYRKTLSLNLLFDFLKSHKIYSAEKEVIFYQVSMLRTKYHNYYTAILMSGLPQELLLVD